MSPAIEFFIYVTVLLLLALVIRRIMFWHHERKFREPLSRELDRFIEEVADHENRPLNDLSIIRFDKVPGRLNMQNCQFSYRAYLKDGDWLDFIRFGTGPRYRFMWRSGAEGLQYFPSYRFGFCRSPWFVDRMKKLTDLLDTYPRDRLLSVRARRALDVMYRVAGLLRN